MSWLDKYLATGLQTVALAGTVLPAPPTGTVNFVSGVTGGINGTTGNLDLTIAGGGGASVTGTGLWRSAAGVLAAAASLGTADQLLATNHAGADVAWFTPSGTDVSYASGVFTVTGIRGVSVPALSNGVLTCASGVLSWTAASGGITALTTDVTASGTGSVAATVVGITGSGGTCTIAAGTSLVATSGAGALTLGAMTGNTTLPTGTLGWSGASGNAASLVANGAAITITAGAASTWTTTSGQLAISGQSGIRLQANTLTLVDVGTTTASTVTLWANASLAGAAGTGALTLGAMTGDTGLPTGNLSWTGASGKTLSLTGSNASDHITLGAAGSATQYGPNGISFGAGCTPAIGQATTTAAAGATTTITPQWSTNATPRSGHLVIALQGATSLAVPPQVQITQGGSPIAILGMTGSYSAPGLFLGGATSTTGTCVQGDGNYLYLRGSSYGEIYVNLGSASVSKWTLTGGPAFAPYNDLGTTLGNATHRWTSAAIQTGISAGTSTSGAGSPFTITTEAAKAASGGAGGNLALVLGAPDGAGTYGALTLAAGATTILSVGMYNNTTTGLWPNNAVAASTGNVGQSLRIHAGMGDGATSNGGQILLVQGTNGGGGTGSTGHIKIVNATTQTTVGAAGPASALPATPTKYYIMEFDSGTYVIPLYAAS